MQPAGTNSRLNSSTSTVCRDGRLQRCLTSLIPIALCTCTLVVLANSSPAQTTPLWGVEFSEFSQQIEGGDPAPPPLNYYSCSGANQGPGTTFCTPQFVSSPSLIVSTFDQMLKHAEASGNGTVGLGSLSATLEATATGPWGSQNFSASSNAWQNLFWLDSITPTGAEGAAVQFNATLILNTVSDCAAGGVGVAFAIVSGLGQSLGTQSTVVCATGTTTFTDLVTLTAGQSYQVQGQLALQAKAGSPVVATKGGYLDTQEQSPGAAATFCLDSVNKSSYITASGFIYQSVNGVCQGGVGGGPPALKINLVSPPADDQYVIDATPTMPVVQATAQVLNVTPDPTPTTQFTWIAKMTVEKGTGQTVDYSKYLHQSLTTTGTAAYTLTTTDPTTLVGGDLTLTVTATVNGKKLTATQDGLTIAGTNPQRSDIQSLIVATVASTNFNLDGLGVSDASDDTERIACQESGQTEFDASADGGIGPVLISRDNGVGTFQLTLPSPFSNPNLLFDWQSNIWLLGTPNKGGLAVFSSKIPPAKGYPGQLRGVAQYKAVIANTVNPVRAMANLSPITITPAPAFTGSGIIGSTPTNQLLEDTTRGFNGYGGPKLYGYPLHEFEPDLNFLETIPDSQLSGLKSNSLVWTRVPVSARGTSGDPNYVANVTAQSPQCGN
jgi:hypothetical protein